MLEHVHFLWELNTYTMFAIFNQKLLFQER